MAAPPTTRRSWEDVAEIARNLRGPDSIKIGPYRAATKHSTPIEAHGPARCARRRIFTPGRPIVEAVTDLSRLIFEEYGFDPTATDWATPLDDVLEHRRGVCQDFAHLATAVLRWRGIPASYVSGYIETDPPPGEVKSIGADASHAWCSVWTGPPEDGALDGPTTSVWMDVDPTNHQVPPSRHVTVGWGRDYADVAPVRGVVLGPGSNQLLDVAVDVTRLPARHLRRAERPLMGIHVAIEHRTTYRFDRSHHDPPARAPAAPGAAHAHADPGVQHDGLARGPLHQLAAGPVRQLPGTARCSTSRPTISMSRSTWWRT